MNEAKAAEYLGYSPSALRAWRAAGTGPSFIKRGKIWYASKVLDDYIARHHLNPDANLR